MKEKSTSDRARESLEAMGLLPYGYANSYRTEILALAKAVDKDFKTTGVTTEERSAFDIFRGGSMMFDAHPARSASFTDEEVLAFCKSFYKLHKYIVSIYGPKQYDESISLMVRCLKGSNRTAAIEAFKKWFVAEEWENY